MALTSDDPAQLVLLAARVRRAHEVRRLLDDELAVAIANRVGEMFAAE